MSDQKTPSETPKKRLLAGVPAAGTNKPRLLAGGGELGGLKIAMSPAAKEAMERAKAAKGEGKLSFKTEKVTRTINLNSPAALKIAEEKAAKQAEEEAKAAAEAQAKYEEEMKAYEAQMAEYNKQLAAQAEAQAAADAEAARIAAEQQALAEAEAARIAEEEAALAKQAEEAAQAEAAAQKAKEEEISRQLAEAQALIEKAKALQEAAINSVNANNVASQPAPTPAVTTPQLATPGLSTVGSNTPKLATTAPVTNAASTPKLAMPTVTTPTGTTPKLATNAASISNTPQLARPSIGTPKASVPTPNVQPSGATSRPSITHTPSSSIPMPTGLKPEEPTIHPLPIGARRTTTKNTEAPTEDASKKTRKKLYILSSVIGVMAIIAGVMYYNKAQAQAAEQAKIDRYYKFCKAGGDPNITTIPADKNDYMLVIDKIKNDQKDKKDNWKAGVFGLMKMIPSCPELPDLILKELQVNAGSYSNEKLRNILFMISTLKPRPEGHKERMLKFYNEMKDEALKAELLFDIYPLFGDDEAPMVLNLIKEPGLTSPEAANAMRKNAESALGDIVRRSENKEKLYPVLKAEYAAAPDNLKNAFVRLMAKTETPEGLDFLKEAIKTGSTITRRNALTAIERWPGDEALVALLEGAQTEDAQKPELESHFKHAILVQLYKPGKERNMDAVNKALDFLKKKATKVADYKEIIGSVGSNCNEDKWAMDIVDSYQEFNAPEGSKLSEDDVDQIRYTAMNKLRKMKEQQAPKKKEEAKK